MQRRTDDGEYRYRPAWWLPGGHLQTLWGRFARRYPRLALTTECLRTPDGDNLEVHTLAGDATKPRVLLLHGLEGSVRSHYVGGALAEAERRDWGATLMVFRGCGAAPNTARRFYHSGETTDVDFAFDTLFARAPAATWFAMGVSLGGNVLLRWLDARGDALRRRLRAAAAVSVPFDLAAGAGKIASELAGQYDRAFLKSLRRKALAKHSRFPDLFQRERLERARNIVDFDDAVTAPVHGYADAQDYYQRCSSIHSLETITVPTLLLSSRDDPFLPSRVLDLVEERARRNPCLTTEFHDGGGHVGFVTGAIPLRPRYYAEARAFRFFDAAMERG